MPVHEALMYWRTEYSIAVDNQDGCHHDWKNNEKRYIYNIRHLYGLEGSRINYRSHCCSSLQVFILISPAHQIQYTPSVSTIKLSGPTYSSQNVRQI